MVEGVFLGKKRGRLVNCEWWEAEEAAVGSLRCCWQVFRDGYVRREGEWQGLLPNFPCLLPA